MSRSYDLFKGEKLRQIYKSFKAGHKDKKRLDRRTHGSTAWYPKWMVKEKKKQET